MIDAGYPQLGDSNLSECVIHGRPGDGTLFWEDDKGQCGFRLHGYAIIPLEEYERLASQADRPTPTQEQAA